MACGDSAAVTGASGLRAGHLVGPSVAKDDAGAIIAPGNRRRNSKKHGGSTKVWRRQLFADVFASFSEDLASLERCSELENLGDEDEADADQAPCIDANDGQEAVEATEVAASTTSSSAGAHAEWGSASPQLVGKGAESVAGGAVDGEVATLFDEDIQKDRDLQGASDEAVATVNSSAGVAPSVAAPAPAVHPSSGSRAGLTSDRGGVRHGAPDATDATATAAVASSIVQAMVHDYAVMKCNIRDYDVALRATLAEARRLRAEVSHMEVACGRVAMLRELLARELRAHAALHSKNAQLAARNEELMSWIHSALDAEGDVECDALLEGLVAENNMLRQLVQISESASRTCVSTLHSGIVPLRPGRPATWSRTRSTPGSTPSRLSPLSLQGQDGSPSGGTSQDQAPLASQAGSGSDGSPMQRARLFGEDSPPPLPVQQSEPPPPPPLPAPSHSPSASPSARDGDATAAATPASQGVADGDAVVSRARSGDSCPGDPSPSDSGNPPRESDDVEAAPEVAGPSGEAPVSAPPRIGSSPAAPAPTEEQRLAAAVVMAGLLLEEDEISEVSSLMETDLLRAPQDVPRPLSPPPQAQEAEEDSETVEPTGGAGGSTRI